MSAVVFSANVLPAQHMGPRNPCKCVSHNPFVKVDPVSDSGVDGCVGVRYCPCAQSHEGAEQFMPIKVLIASTLFQGYARQGD